MEGLPDKTIPKKQQQYQQVEHLQFEDQAFLEQLSEDGLLLMARGLGLDRLFLKFLKLYSDSHNLVLAINTPSELEQYFISELLREGVEQLPKSITNEFSAKERQSLYLGGGALFVTSRILVVDLLRAQCPVDKVSGLLVWNAHRVTDSSTEAFILRLYRQANQSGFVKAFSELPEPFTSGFCQLEKVMRNLFIKNVYLWPRFHATVSATLSRHKPDVIELRQQMTPAMTAIQMAVLDIMRALVAELKRAHPALDTDDVTIENCMSKSFDQIIRMQLDPVWNLLGFKTKQLVFDLRLQRTLLHFLVQYDCVTFYRYLQSLRSGGSSLSLSSHSAWIFLDSANTLFVKARERVFGGAGLEQGSDSKQMSDSKKQKGRAEGEALRLEENPKWHLLSMVLDEVRGQAPGKVLVIVSDERTGYQLRQYLCGGGEKLLRRQFERVVKSQQASRTEGVQFQPQPAELSEEACLTRKRPLQEEGASRRKKAKTGAVVKAASVESDEDDTGMSLPTIEVEDEFFSSNEAITKMVFDTEGKLHHSSGADDGIQFELVNEPVVVLQSINPSRSPHHLTLQLRELMPTYVVMYDADVTFVRQIEVFKASHPGMPLRVYFLLYDSSVEEQKYLTALRKEKESFQQLIQERAHMMVPLDREGKLGAALMEDPILPSTVAGSSRKAGGRQEKCAQRVIVDVREFRSTLPSVLHKKGMEIVPLTLEVGDYILTENICVERKSVSDLIGSLNSGRLYNQAMAMMRHYKKPILLIEFEGKRPFSLQGSSAGHGEISSQSVSSKLVLLTLHFPKLRILWCSSAHATAELFRDLKAKHPQPDPSVALTVGQDTLDMTESAVYNATAQDFLLKLPGINSKNYRAVMDKVSDFQELVSLSVKELDTILGNSTNASLLWNFLHNDTSVK